MPSCKKTAVFLALLSVIAATSSSAVAIWNRASRESDQRDRLEKLQVQLDGLQKEIDSIRASINSTTPKN